MWVIRSSRVSTNTNEKRNQIKFQREIPSKHDTLEGRDRAHPLMGALRFFTVNSQGCPVWLKPYGSHKNSPKWPLKSNIWSVNYVANIRASMSQVSWIHTSMLHFCESERDVRTSPTTHFNSLPYWVYKMCQTRSDGERAKSRPRHLTVWQPCSHPKSGHLDRTWA